jgi:AcrR family transcriptional regulator
MRRLACVLQARPLEWNTPQGPVRLTASRKRCYHETTDRSVGRVMQRADIIHAAAQIFREKGYDGTSMQDIADAVHLQKASLYHHVSSKQEILLTILNQALDLLIADMSAVMAEDLPAEDKLRRAMRVYIERLTQDADLAAVLLLEHRSLSGQARQRHILRRDRYENLWRSLIKEGIEEGSFQARDERLVCFALLGVLNWMVTWYREEGQYRPAELADFFSSVMLEGLAHGSPERES